MTSQPDPHFSEPWYVALGSEYGIALRVSNIPSAINALNRAKKALSDPKLNSISIHQCPDDDEVLWLVKRLERKPNGQEATPPGPILDIAVGEPGDAP